MGWDGKSAPDIDNIYQSNSEEPHLSAIYYQKHFTTFTPPTKAGCQYPQLISSHSFMKKHWPLFTTLCSVVLFLLAAAVYPGGTADSSQTIGYDWTNNTISSLFQPNALNGEINASRYYAITAMLLYCGSLGFMLRFISKSAATRFHEKTIEIAGIGFAVYMFLIVTPMHNLMVTVALLFFLVTVLAMLHSLYVQKSILLLTIGAVSVSIPLINATIYYGDFIYGVLPVVQKIGAFACAIWFILIYYNTHDVNLNEDLPKKAFE